jgi:deoxyribodipyrimidine photolyase-related protein
MKEALAVFPHQLFLEHPGLSRDREIFLIEEPLFFFDREQGIKFHKQKIMLHRSSLRNYCDFLKKQGYQVHYHACRGASSTEGLFPQLVAKGIEKLYICDLADNRLEHRVQREAGKLGISLEILPTPGFLATENWIREFFRNARHLSQTKFYIAQRKRLNILLEAGKPAGGRWTFDSLNRKRIPHGLYIPALPTCETNPYTQEAAEYVDSHFPEHTGASKDFRYPVTHREAGRWLDDFLETRLFYFGDYQDAMVQDNSFLFHSVLAPMLNIGLLTPQHIIDRTLAYVEDTPIPMNCLEGFLRQIIGWREFMRAVYLLRGEQQRASNFWGFQRPLPSFFYSGKTEIIPIEFILKRLRETAYVHHIERLMVLGNFMLLCEIQPQHVYRWFMEFFIDAYDWVMVPNVFGMSQFSDGGTITTKPYISSSRYLLKMGDFPRGRWTTVWDGLFWRFIHTQRSFFVKNPRMQVMTYQLDRMGKERLRKHLDAAEDFLGAL